MKNNIGSRIKELYTKLGFETQHDFAKKINYNQQNISNYEHGKFKPSQKFYDAVLVVYPNINIQWLQTGEGEMLFNTQRLATSVEQNGNDQLPDDVNYLKSEIIKLQNKLKQAQNVIDYFIDSNQQSPTSQLAVR